ncbi:M36 family metallopeptidase [Nocardioides bizhenqiangii]|uniref:M36 family metallopeptidase n=1 Tax=Nocardioides bizhenqiangii TaxID=3095076 RepID=A0ABZ0ZWH7_9ACTN|nr:M36 family metallopeptidase [Nocardioides sp. HM61]WQQ27638.1 M36 family metallopeptidase [Nocardioides sp. HM61]
MNSSASLITSRRKWVGAWAVAAVAVVSMGVPGPSDGAAASRATPGPTDRSGDATALTNYDVRILSGDRRARADARQVRANGKAVARLSRSIGPDAVIDIDPLTGTPDQVAGRTTMLTGPSSRPAASVALDFVRAHLAAFGLERADLSTFVKVREYTDIHGVTHVYWAQQVAGDRVFGNGLRAHVDRRGRLISVQGAPIAGLGILARRAPSSHLGRSAAIRKAVTDTRLARPDLRPGATADRVWFFAPGGLRPAWLTYTEPGSAAGYEHVIDSATGSTLYRRSTVNFDGDAFVHENYPGATGRSRGGRAHHVNLIKRGFLLPNANFPKGKYATVWPDLNDDDKRQARETTPLPENRRQAYRMRLKGFPTAQDELRCSPRYKCSWDPTQAFSWRKNMAHDAIQGLYLTSRFAKWLSRPPFGFDRSSGNFTRKDGDPVDLNAIDGANTADGFPDGNHVNNANFSTPPDGRRPRMQMYLNYSPYLAASSSDDFLTLGHEFTHGLSNRLVVNSNNHSTLNSYQAGAMGEGWSDFYAFDYLLFRDYTTDTPEPGELSLDLYLAKGAVVTRTQAMDCGLDEASPRCVQILTGDDGGYTYDDVGDGQLGTQVHAAGEAWAQTLFDIRERLRHGVTMTVVTEGMRLAPDDPSMLDMRDAIIAADEAIYGGAHVDALWRKFADRGFGFYAGSDDGADAAPVADFNVPPPPGTLKGRIAGTVTDRDGNPLAGAVVRVAGHSEYSDVTDADGEYQISGVVAGTWPKVVATLDGYEPESEAVTVVGQQTTDFNPSLRRDWASASGGASIASFTGPDLTDIGCGPIQAIDLSQGSGWGSDTTATGDPADSEDDVDPKEIVIELPQQITLTEFGVNPSNTCGDPGSASTAGYEIYVAPTPSGPWGAPVADGTFTPEDRGTMVEIPVGAPIPNVGAVRYVMLSPQVPDWSGCPFDYAGCQFMDTTEVAAYDD